MAEIVELIGNPRPGSRTRTLADAVAQAVARTLAEAGTPLRGTEVIELAEIVGVSFGSEPAYGNKTEIDPFTVVREARLLIVGSPTYKGTYTGLLKIFLDQYGQDPLAGVVAVPTAIAAAPPHRESIAAALHDLLVALGATVPGPPLAVLESELAAATPEQIAAGWVADHGAAVAAALTRTSADPDIGRIAR
jgi:FMN reductase